jgi:transcriptional regulator with XRE-family HTH domain
MYFGDYLEGGKNTGMDVRKTNSRPNKSGGRLPGKAEMPEALADQEHGDHSLAEGPPSALNHEAAELPAASAGNGPKPFSVLLGSLIKNDRSEILRIAREIGVSDNTVYRWINGTSEPRASHMQRLLEVLPRSHTPQTSVASGSNGRGTPTRSTQWDVPKEIYRRVMEQAAITVDDASRRWHIVETIFEYALLHLDPDRRGMALTYARLMPPCEDGTIHSLYEAEMRGQAPWPFALDFKAYLGSTTLAGIAAMLQRVHTWNEIDEDTRHPVGLDENEHSSCAAPVMRGGRLAGVLIVSSAQNDFMRNPSVPRAVGDYAHLLAAGMLDSDFYPVSLIRLVPMPDLKWQRERIANTYLNRVVEYARKQCLSFTEAEQKVLRDLEVEFEQEACRDTFSGEAPTTSLEKEAPYENR